MTLVRARGLIPATALLACLLPGCSGGGQEAGGAPQPPPVLLITVDGLVAEELSAFGGERETPALASLVSSAAVWRDSWTASPVTRSAVATYLTGLAPDRHRVVDDVSSRLPEDLPTLATLLAAEGYATAAFPGSSLLGASSRLARGFGIVDDPPAAPFGPPRRIPVSTPPQDTAEHFKLWLDSLAPGAPWFAWLHFSAPILEQFDRLDERQFGASEKGLLGDLRARILAERTDKAAPASEGDDAGTIDERSVAGFDSALGAILAALEVRGEARRALVVLAPTLGDISGGADEPPGPGLSLHERAIRVPLVVRLPAAGARPRDTELPAWAPDVAATVAALTGVTLADGAEGLSLFENPPADRVLLAWSWATRDQMGWLPLRAARRGGWKRVEGIADATTFRLDGAAGEPDAEAAAALAGALATRSDVPPDEVDLDVVRPWFEANGIAPRPVPTGGRAFGPRDARRDAAALVWNARYEFAEQRFSLSPLSWRGALQADPDNLAARLGLGQTLSLMRAPQAEGVLRAAVALYPGDWDLLHWLAHALWQESWPSAEKLLIDILPHRPDDPDVLYDLACARSLDGDPAASADFLRAALEAGFRDWSLVETDSDLRNLRQTPRFSALLREYGR